VEPHLDRSAVGRLQLFAYDQDFDKPRWSGSPIRRNIVFNPINIVYDIDSDGVQSLSRPLPHD
jgi:hypothetical protein